MFSEGDLKELLGKLGKTSTHQSSNYGVSFEHIFVYWVFCFCFFFFFYLGFLSRTFTIHGTAGEGGGYLFNSSLPLPPASRALRHWPGDCCRELASAHSWQPDSSREPLVSERQSLTTKLRGLG